MWEPDYDEQARYWIEKEAASKGMGKEKLKEWIEAFIKLFDTENNANARRFLETQDLSTEEIEQICSIINNVSFSKNRGNSLESIEGKIVQDADRLDALGAIGIARTFAYGGKNGRSLEDSLQHFHDKLLLLKDEMNTAEAKRLATERHKYLEGFIAEFKVEADGKYDRF